MKKLKEMNEEGKDTYVDPADTIHLDYFPIEMEGRGST